ncbi:hypothetical protein ANAEL_00382 [Anaerolineales bacterium]|nr:hypothetical protein ANAEL_00382 [Anaerolineales bacterium]
MPQEQNNLIIGAAISLLSAILVFVLTSVYHWIDKNRDRSWAIEDRKYQRRLEILTVRLKETENYINHIYDVAHELMIYQMALLATKIIDDKGFDEVFGEIYEKIQKIAKDSSSILNLNDEELQTLNDKLRACIVNEIEISMSLKEKIKNNKVANKKIEQDRIEAFYEEIIDIKKAMMKRVDELLGLN